MKTFFKRSGALILAALLPATAFATNGMFMIGAGSRSVAMGGASIANPQDSFTGAYNPAAIAEVGTRADIDGTLFIPKAAAQLGNTRVESSSDLFLMPAMGMVMPIDNETIMGFSFVPVGGGGSNYRTNLYNPAHGNVGVNLMIANMNPTLAQRLNDTHTVGGNLIIGAQRFKAWGLSEFNTFTPGAEPAKDMTDRGSEFSYGLGMRFGWLGSYKDLGLKLGAAYTTRTHMKPFDRYKELFAGHGDIDTPGNAAIGASLKITPKILAAFDIVRIYYEDVKSIANPGPNLPGSSGWPPVSDTVNGLGADEGLGFGWHDQTVYKLGFQYAHNSNWTWRAGWNYGKSPIPEEREILFNLLAPATTQWHMTLGGTYKIDRGTELNFAYMHAFTFQQSGPTYITTKNAPDGTPLTGSIEMYQNAFSVGIGFTL